MPTRRNLPSSKCWTKGRPSDVVKDFYVKPLRRPFPLLRGLGEQDRGQHPPGKHGRRVARLTVREPVGVVGQILPWNVPLLMMAWKLSPALAAGCTVVVKPAEDTPLTALRMAELCQEAGLPDGVVNVLTGDGSAGAALVDHPDVDKIGFTGSTATGKAIVRSAAASLNRVELRAGRQEPGLRLPGRRPDRAIPGAAESVPLTVGKPALPARGSTSTRTSTTACCEGVAAYADG